MEKNQSFEYFCKTNNKLELLKLYNREKNKEKPNEIYYSGTKKYFFKCPSCNMEWTGKMNKMNSLSKGEYNVIKKQKEITYWQTFYHIRYLLRSYLFGIEKFLNQSQKGAVIS